MWLPPPGRGARETETQRDEVEGEVGRGEGRGVGEKEKLRAGDITGTPRLHSPPPLWPTALQQCLANNRFSINVLIRKICPCVEKIKYPC